MAEMTVAGALALAEDRAEGAEMPPEHRAMLAVLAAEVRRLQAEVERLTELNRQADEAVIAVGKNIKRLTDQMARDRVARAAAVEAAFREGWSRKAGMPRGIDCGYEIDAAWAASTARQESVR